MEAINVETMRIVAVQDVDRQIVDGLPWPSSSFIIAIIIIGILIIPHSHSSLLSYKHHHQESSTKNIGLICRKWLQLWIFTKRMTLTMPVKSLTSAPSVTILVLIVQEMPSPTEKQFLSFASCTLSVCQSSPTEWIHCVRLLEFFFSLFWCRTDSL